MKKIFVILISFLFLISSIYSQDKSDNKLRIKVPSFNENGEIEETTYVADFPTTYDDAKKDLELLVDIYDEVTKNYKTQLEEDRKYIAEILNELKIAKEQNETLQTIDSAVEGTDIQNEKTKKTIKDQFESFGIIGEYGVINDSNEISLQLGIKLWKFTFAAGPNIAIPKSSDGKVDFGFRGSIGFWF
jgi:hypothetical protein